MKYCPKCQQSYPHNQRFCPQDGGQLLLQDPYHLITCTLGDRYRIDALIGIGGMGAVYSAHHLVLDRTVAFKILQPNLALGNQLLIDLFVREARTAGQLSHENIISISDAGRTADNIAYLVMEWLDGRTLQEELSVRGQLSLERTAEILQQVAAALEYAHAARIIHRDLKPDNVMLIRKDGREQVKVLDFGLAKVISETTDQSVSRVMGTLPYMSPEQFRLGAPIDGRTDIYSLGVMLYQLLTGALPFNATSDREMAQLHLTAPPPPIRQLQPEVPEAIERLISRMMAKDPDQRPPQAAKVAEFFAQALETPSEMQHEPIGKVALLYKRHAQPDEQVLKLLETQLGAQGYRVFVDRHLSIGVEWAKEIERQVRTSDIVIPLLSAASVSSEMLAYEVQIAHEASQEQNGKPRLLPVRVNYDGLLPDPLAAILDPIQYALWHSPKDDEALVDGVLKAIKNAAAPPSAVWRKKLEPVGGAVPLDSKFYLVRPTDEEFQAAIARQDSIVLVKGARQMGKTSLLARGLQQARAAGAKVVLTDFQKLNAAHLESVETLFMTLAELIADQLDLDVLPDQTWNPRRGPSINFERYLKREVLGKLSAPLVWGLDEVDRLFTCSFGGEVFGLFRSWHNERSLDPAGPWQRLTLAIAYATEAHLFITDVNQSPFNVGTRLALDDFTFEQVAELNRRYDSPLPDPGEVARYFRLVGGHPYLVRRGLHKMVTHGIKLAAFEAQADRDEGPFGDHLRRILILLAQDAALTEVVRGVLRGRPCPTAESFYRLRSAGVMSGDSARDVRPRCQLYATYLERHLL